MFNSFDTLCMQRALDISKLGKGSVAPNPLVGCVIAYDHKIISEGFHTMFGKPHAEPEAIHKVKDQEVLKKSTLYVTLEPCNHVGKTPACTDLIYSKNIPRVVVATRDPNPLVSGKGIQRLINAGIQVEVGLLEKEAMFINRRFFTWHIQNRPYVILKWAQSKDRFINQVHQGISKQVPISGEYAQMLSHQWRSKEQAILVGTNTVLTDNPRLTNRKWVGNNPLRIFIDKQLKVDKNYHLLSDEFPTVIFHSSTSLIQKIPHKEFIYVKDDDQFMNTILQHLYLKNIQSVIIEGGSAILQTFIDLNIWDEARVFSSSNIYLLEGIRSPNLSTIPSKTFDYKTDSLDIFYNNQQLYALGIS